MFERANLPRIFMVQPSKVKRGGIVIETQEGKDQSSQIYTFLVNRVPLSFVQEKIWKVLQKETGYCQYTILVG